MPCFVLRLLYTCLVVPAREACAAIHVVCMFLVLPISSENGLGILKIDFVCMVSDRKPLHDVFLQPVYYFEMSVSYL